MKKINLFSGEGASLLSQDILLWSSESERCIFEIGNEEAERGSRTVPIPVSSAVQCTSCHVTFIDREDQVFKIGRHFNELL